MRCIMRKRKSKLYRQIVENNKRVAEENYKKLKEAYANVTKDGEDDAKTAEV